MRVPDFFLAAAFSLSALVCQQPAAFAQRPPTDRHVAELARYFDGVKIASPIVQQGLAVYPVSSTTCRCCTAAGRRSTRPSPAARW